MNAGTWHNPYTAVAATLFLGIFAQWLGWRLHLPAILLLLLFGILANEFGIIRPDALLGDLLVPVASFSVALILFEGSLGLKVADFKQAGALIRNIILVGIAVTWVLCALACRFILQLPWSVSLLVSGILTVTGPTVILPMLRYIRPSPQTARILRWEGIVNDPLGSLLAVIVFESILVSGFQATFYTVLGGIIKTVLVGVVLGYAVAWLFVWMLSRRWIPVYLENPVALMMVLATFAGSNMLQTDSGLFTVTVMGLFFSNQRRMDLTHIVEFKENLGLIMLSTLFVLLAARLRFEDFTALGWQGLAFLAVLILIIRPVAVLMATRGQGLGRNETLFLAAMAPRGIVAAAISSVFALRLEEAGYPYGEAVVRTVFLTILGTVTFYSLIAMPLARALKLAGQAEGVLILGAHAWAQELALALRQFELPVVLVDSNLQNVYAARMRNLEAVNGNILSDRVMEDLDLTPFGHFLALSSNPEVNALAGLRFQSVFGRDAIYTLSPEEKGTAGVPERGMSGQLRGRTLFGAACTYDYLSRLQGEGMRITSVSLRADFDYEALQAACGNRAVPLAVVDQGRLRFFTDEDRPVPRPDQALIALVPPGFTEPPPLPVVPA